MTKRKAERIEEEPPRKKEKKEIPKWQQPIKAFPIQDSNNWILYPPATKYARKLLKTDSMKISEWLKIKSDWLKISSDEESDQTQSSDEESDQTQSSEESISDDEISIIPMKTYLQRSEIHSPLIIERKATMEVWNQVYQWTQSKLCTHAVVSGNPGVGKSRSLACFLRMLMKKGHTVVYLSRKDECYFAFIPPTLHDKGDDYVVWSADMNGFKRRCPVLENLNNYFLIDPEEAGSEKPVGAHTILAASPNRKHYKEFLKFDPRPRRYFIPVWSWKEIQSMSKAIGFDLDNENLRERFDWVGGMPRYIFGDEESFDDQIAQIRTDLTNTTFDSLISFLQSEKTIEVDQTGGKKNVSSSLVCWDIDSNRSVTERFFVFRAVQKVTSDNILLLLMEQYYDECMNLMDPNNRSHGRNLRGLGFFFEYMARSIIRIGGTFQVRPLHPPQSDEEKSDQTQSSEEKSDQTESSEEKSDQTESSEEKSDQTESSENISDDDVTLDIPGSCTFGEQEKWTDLLAVIPNLQLSINIDATNRELWAGPTNQPVLDFVDARDRGFQVTLSQRHEIKPGSVKNLLKKANVSSFKLYFVVPEPIYKVFEYQSGGESLEQWALCIPKRNEELKKQSLSFRKTIEDLRLTLTDSYRTEVI